MKKKILLIEDDNCCRPGIIGSLSRRGYAVSQASNLANAEQDVLARRFDAVILGINLADGHGTGLIRRIRAFSPCLPIVVLTGGAEIEIAVDAVRCGADNVLAKPVDYAALSAFLESHLGNGSLKPEPAAVRQPKAWSEEDFFGTGPAARRFIELAAGAAKGNSPVLITGETGTGKGMLARWMHQNGNRSARPFAGVNCSGLRGDLLKAEIFGACCGARSGRFRNNPGLLGRADGGTLFLDEIGDMDPTAQAGLLAVLEGRGSRPGARGEMPDAGVRLICSSNQRLDALAHAGSFLPELLCCISATVLRIRPLRERLLELPGIVRHLLEELRGPGVQITDEAIRVLKGYPWPGNLRELKNALEQGVLLSHDTRLGPEHFSWLKPLSRARELYPMRSAGGAQELQLAVRQQ